MNNNLHPIRIINSLAPIRICDNGGWTDTWFARYGRIFNIAVSPFAEVQISVFPSISNGRRCILKVVNFGDEYEFIPGDHVNDQSWEKHPLLEAAIEFMDLPEGTNIEILIRSKVPSGAGTGTSAAVTVALLGVLDRLSPGRMSAYELAYAAHKIETELLKQQSGIQDQLCCAFGGINYIEMHDYPKTNLSPITVPEKVLWELEQRLLLIYLGDSHHSSQVHKMVIHGLEDAGPDCKQLEDLRSTAPQSRDALQAGNFAALGQAMVDNTEAQRRLHPALISTHAQQVIDIAHEYGALGWKVNGAGGEGGSISILCNSRRDAHLAMLNEIKKQNAEFIHIPIRLRQHGVRVWESN
jgi:D-glycero-alpha-D-manno-heptose-7-phosphate kinase